MAESYAARLLQMLRALTETLQILQDVLRQLPIPIEIIPLGDNHQELLAKLDRTRELIQDLPLGEATKVQLDQGILTTMIAVEQLRQFIETEGEEEWREDAFYLMALLATANAHLVSRFLKNEEQTQEGQEE